MAIFRRFGVYGLTGWTLPGATLAGWTLFVLAAQTGPARAKAMSGPEVVQTLIVGAAVLLAVAMALWAYRATRRSNELVREQNSLRTALDMRLDEMDAILSAEPDAVFIWSQEMIAAPPGSEEARPRVVGSTVGVAHPETGEVDYDYLLERLQEDHAARLDAAVKKLHERGSRFSLQVRARDGRTFDAEGRPAGAQAVLWVRDVTGERAEASRLIETARNARSERQALAQVLNAVPVPIWRLDEDGNLLWVNKAYARAVEQKSPGAAVRNATLIVPKASGSAPERRRATAVIDGSRRVLDVLERPVEGGSVAIALDMTERDEAQAELDRHMKSQADVLDRLVTAVAIFGPDQHLAFCNNAFARLWNLDRAWLETGPSDSAILDDLRNRSRLPEQASFQAWKAERLALYNSAEPKEEYWHLPDGRTVRALAQPHPQGGVIYLYENVTEKVDLQSSYNTLMRVQRETLDNLSEGVAVFGTDGRLKLFNPPFSRIWNLMGETLANEPHVETVIGACRKLYDENGVWEAIKGRITGLATDRTQTSGRMERPDGTIIDYASVPLPDGATLLTFVDVTDSSRIERALRERNNALETADRLKSEFIGHVSYQLRTPLTNIIGFAEILDAEMFGPLNEKQHEYSLGVLEASEELLNVVNDILDLATIEAGAMTLELSDVDVADIVASAQEFGHRRAQKNKVSLDVVSGPGLGTIRADERRIKQIMMNLLSNAISFTRPGDTITVGAERSRGEVRLFVADTGDGIEPEFQATVFDRFEASSTADRRRGAGLGLSLVRSFVELHGGWVTLESTPELGTKVTCHLPEDAAAGEEAGSPRLEAAG